MCTHRGGAATLGTGSQIAAGVAPRPANLQGMTDDERRAYLQSNPTATAGQQAAPAQQTPAQQMSAVRMQNAQQLIAGLKGTTGARYAQFLDPANSDRIVVTIDKVPSRRRGGAPSFRVQVDNNTTGVRLWYGYHDTLAQAKNEVYRATGVDKPTRRRSSGT